MAKYKEILVQKAETGKRREKKQEQLRDESGIKDTKYYLIEKDWKAYVMDAVKHVCYLTYAILVFIGTVMLLHPESRHIILQIFHLA